MSLEGGWTMLKKTVAHRILERLPVSIFINDLFDLVIHCPSDSELLRTFQVAGKSRLRAPGCFTIYHEFSH